MMKWDQLDSVYQYKWNFSNLENAFEEGGVLHGKKVYLFGCTEPQQVCFKDVEKVILVPIIVAIEVSNIYLELHPKEGCFETFKVGSSMSIACHVFCSFDWKFNDLEEFSDELIKDEELSADRKHEFKDFVKEKVREEKKANKEAREARRKVIEEMSEETKCHVINRYYGKAHEYL
ncbi:uncharacterized protein DS421_15g524590 [Arachis hypogaea]|nr:uncharacterized protein DS421_15g524590 [Arachis hypogaea]